jgi:hypothetical protein
MHPSSAPAASGSTPMPAMTYPTVACEAQPANIKARPATTRAARPAPLAMNFAKAMKYLLRRSTIDEREHSRAENGGWELHA